MDLNHKVAKEFAKRWQGQWSEDQYAPFWVILCLVQYLAAIVTPIIWSDI